MATPIIAPKMPTNFPSAGGWLGSQGSQSLQRQNKLFDENNTGLNWITGPGGDPTQGPLYKSFLTKARTATSNAYDNAMINSRANANARGFGYASPNEGVTEAGIRGQEASELGAAPGKALQATMPYDMEALGMRADEAKTFGSEGMGMYDLYNQDELARYNAQQQNKRTLYSSLGQLAGTILSGPLGADLGTSIFGPQQKPPGT